MFEQALEQYLKKSLIHAPEGLRAPILYSTLDAGKRIRPKLMIAMTQALGIDTQLILPAAAALEIVHCFTLIHDDLPCMDDDELRRGKPSCHKQFGEAAALLAGDAMIPLAYEILLQTDTDAPKLLEAYRTLCQALGPQGVIGGQVREMEGKTISQTTVTRMHAEKTASLFVAACVLPSNLFLSHSTDKLQECGSALGLAFQLADDLEDRFEHSPTSMLEILPLHEAQHMATNYIKTARDSIQHLHAPHTLEPLFTSIEEKIHTACSM